MIFSAVQPGRSREGTVEQGSVFEGSCDVLCSLLFFVFLLPLLGIGIKDEVCAVLVWDNTGDAMADDVILRLKKMGGQVEGLIRMLERGESCENVITQFQAAKAALDTTFSLVLERNLKECMSHDDSKNVEKILKLISKQ